MCVAHVLGPLHFIYNVVCSLNCTGWLPVSREGDLDWLHCTAGETSSCQVIDPSSAPLHHCCTSAPLLQLRYIQLHCTTDRYMHYTQVVDLHCRDELLQICCTSSTFQFRSAIDLQLLCSAVQKYGRGGIYCVQCSALSAILATAVENVLEGAFHVECTQCI